MELLRPCLFFYLLAILLSLSISSTTNSDHTNPEKLQWKGGEGAKRSRVRRNLNLQHPLRLPEKAYTFYLLWRLLNEMDNKTTTIKLFGPDKLEFTTPEGPKNTEIEVKTSSAPIQEQSNYSIGLTGTNDTTAKASFPTEPSSLDSQKTTQLEDLQLVEQSTQRLQTTIQKITEPNQATEQHIPESTSNIPSTAAEEPSTIALHELIDHFTRINDTNTSTSMSSFPIDSLQDSQETTQSGDSQLIEQSVQHSQTTKQNITEPTEVTQRNILDSPRFSTNISFKAEEKNSSVALHELIDHFTRINDTNNSTDMVSFPIDSLPDSQETTQSGDSQLIKQSVQHSQTTKQNITEPTEVTERNILDSPKFSTNISFKAEEKNSSVALHEQIDHFTRINNTNNSTSNTFPIDSLPDSQETTQSGDSQLIKQSVQHSQTTKQNITEPTEVTERNLLDSPRFSTNISFKAEEKNSSVALHELIDHFTGINHTNTSTSMSSFPIDSLPDLQETTQSGDSELEKESTQRKIPEPIIRSIGIIGTTASTDMMSLPTERSLQEKQKNTQSGAPQLLKHSTQDFQSPEKFTKPSLKIRQHTTYRIQQETPLESATDPHIQTNYILASTIENDNLEPTSLPQMTENEQPKMTPFINGMVQSISKTAPPSRTKQTTLSTDKPEIIKKFNSDLSESTSDPELHKPKHTEEPSNQQTEGTINTAKSSRDSAMQPFMITNTQRLINYRLGSSKTASTSPLPNPTENHLVDSKEPEHTSLPTSISLQDYTSFRIYKSNAKSQSQRTTNKYTILRKVSHSDTSTQAPPDGVSTEKLIMMFTPTPKPLEKHIHTTSVVSNRFLKSRTQENPSWISTKRSNIQPTITKESQSDSKNQDPTADSVSKENYTNNDLQTKTNKPTQGMSGRKPSTTTSGKPKAFLFPTHKSADSTIEDDTNSHIYISVSLFIFGCLILLIIVSLLREIWRRWQARNFGSNMWVAGPPLLQGTYHSVSKNSSSHTAIQMRNENSQKKKQGNSDVHETIALKQQYKDFV